VASPARRGATPGILRWAATRWRPCIWMISDLPGNCVANGKNAGTTPVVRRAYADPLEPGLHSRRRQTPNRICAQSVALEFDYPALPGMDAGCAPVGTSTKRLQNHRRRAPGGYQLQAAVSGRAAAWTPPPRPRLSPPASSSPVTALGRRWLLPLKART